jgi:RNA polymerase sigma-70 factor, ECF subfamily
MASRSASNAGIYHTDELVYGPSDLMSGGADPDAELVVAIARGERPALGALYDKYATFLMSLAIRIVKDRREAEDLLHDVFLEVWRSAVDYDPGRGRVRTWLAIRMRSRCLDRQKSARVSRQSGDDSVLDRVAAEGSNVDAGPDQAKVRTAIGALTDDQRRVIELAYFEGLSCSEIASQIAVPIGTVKSRMAAAMTKLRDTLSYPESP